MTNSGVRLSAMAAAIFAKGSLPRRKAHLQQFDLLSS
jgi:hypothetical protein